MTHVEQRLREMLPLPAEPEGRTPLERRIKEQLRRDEGEKLYAYPDSEGYWTIGIGVLIDKRKGGGITKEESEYLFMNRLKWKIADLDRHLPWWRDFNEARQGVLLNMTFQMGIGTPGKGDGLLGFVNTLRMMQAGDHEGAARGMRNSKWNQQTPERSDRLAEQWRTGEWK